MLERYGNCHPAEYTVKISDTDNEEGRVEQVEVRVDERERKERGGIVRVEREKVSREEQEQVRRRRKRRKRRAEGNKRKRSREKREWKEKQKSREKRGQVVGRT